MFRFAKYFALLSILFFLQSCDDDPGGPSGGGGTLSFRSPTLENIWPSGDGSAWHYELTVKSTGPSVFSTFPTEEEVPPQPSLEQILAAVAELGFEDPDALHGDYTVRFEGTGETESGAVGKRVVSELDLPISPPPVPKLQQLPAFDLRGRASSSKAEEFERITPILFVSEGIWAQGEDYIGFYNDLDQEARFRLVIDEFDIGAHWRMQTIPALAPDVWLDAEVVDRVHLRTPAGSFRNVVRILYVFDTGAYQIRDAYEPSGEYLRSLLFAVIDFAPGVGPVMFREVRTTVGSDSEGAPVIEPPLLVYEGILASYDVSMDESGAR